MWRGEKLTNEKIVLSTIAHCRRLKSFRKSAALVLTTLMMVVAATTGTAAQTFKTLHTFDYTDGAEPYAGLVQATNGKLYSTTSESVDNNAGTVFEITTGGKLTTLYDFCVQSGCLDGSNPYAGLVQATNGNLYGTTVGGGANYYGTVFKITTSGTLTTLHNFDSTDGSQPIGLVQATNGYLYGTTDEGGTNNAGTVFKITPSGKLTTLHSFDGRHGSNPVAGLIQATDGSFYGTTFEGGAHYNATYCPEYCGTIFKITPSGKLTVVYSFCAQSDCTDGRNPVAGLIQATNGDFYGTTPEGGTNDYGTIFKITPSGTLTTLHSFDGTDGGFPQAGLVQDTNGDFYGTTSGVITDGTVFSLSLGLGPFVETQTTSGKVGAAVKILGTSLTGATSVTFNGTAAVFKVVAPSLITTTVPTGATTGTVEVTTPKGTLKGNVAFHVTP
jgi:uncharacterized repeat protein (TIGR03803 family)